MLVGLERSPTLISAGSGGVRVWVMNGISRPVKRHSVRYVVLVNILSIYYGPPLEDALGACQRPMRVWSGLFFGEGC